MRKDYAGKKRQLREDQEDGKELALITEPERGSEVFDLSPGTPTPSHKPNSGDASLCDDNCVTSGLEFVPPSTLQDSNNSLCRADMSRAALLLVQQLAVPQETGQSVDAAAERPAKKRKVYDRGNYKDYYSIRLGPEHQEDPRLEAMQKRWFVNRRCLDIGCNKGLFTLELVKRFQCQSMLGLDIDENLVIRACTALRNTKNDAAKELEIAKGSRKMSRINKAYEVMQGLCNVWFQTGDILTSKLEEHYYDTVTCMSVTKWIHIFIGDNGLKSFFRKVKQLLRPGGYFILEPQPWKSYKRAVNKLRRGDSKPVDLKTLHLHPEKFVEYLTKELGFRLLKEQGPGSIVAGFNRPIYWFKKP